jgi:hypothetical protein
MPVRRTWRRTWRACALALGCLPPGSGYSLAIVRHRAPLSAPLFRSALGGGDGGLVVGTSRLAPGAYDAVLASPAGGERGRPEFAVAGRHARPRDAPGNRYDWLAIIRGTRSRLVSYLRWRYTGADVDGQLAIDPTAQGAPALSPGRYAVWLCLDDGFWCTARAGFTIRAG